MNNFQEYSAGLFDSDGTISSTLKNSGEEFGLVSRVRIGCSAPYVAGMFDGDGSISSILRAHKTVGIVTSLGITATGRIGGPIMQIVEKLRELGFPMKARIIRHGDWLDSIRFGLDGKENIYKFLSWIEPYTILKRDQIRFWLSEIYPRYVIKGTARTRNDLVEIAGLCLQLSLMKNTTRAGKLKWTPEKVSKWCEEHGRN